MNMPTSFPTITDAIEYLESYGDPDAIAVDLEQRGIRAKVGCPHSCAVAIFLATTVNVDQVYVYADYAREWYGSGRFETTTLGRHVRNFVDRFDMGSYPSLELKKVNA